MHVSKFHKLYDVNHCHTQTFQGNDCILYGYIVWVLFMHFNYPCYLTDQTMPLHYYFHEAR